MILQRTPSGIEFGILGEKPAAPGPLLISIAGDIASSLENKDYSRIGVILAKKGFLSVALDIPDHGIDVRPGQPEGLLGWRARLERNENFVEPFTRKVSEVLDYLVRERYADPEKIVVAGTSRGGFIGLHLMAAEPRIRCGVAFAPVAELPLVKEFNGLENHPLTSALALPKLADKLAGRPIWVCIGNNDQRVGVDSVIAFTRQVVAASLAQGKPAPIEIHVMQTEGHSIHQTAHQEAAAWVAAQVQ